MMEDQQNQFLPNYVEHLVPLQEKKKVLPKKCALAAMAVLLAVAVFFIITYFFPFLGGVIPFFLLGDAVLVWFLWRFVSVEYEYTILQGEITFEVIYGRRQRKMLYHTPLSRVEAVRFAGGKKPEKAPFDGVKKEIFAASSWTNPRTYLMLVREETGEKTLVAFELPERAEKVLRFYAARAFTK